MQDPLLLDLRSLSIACVGSALKSVTVDRVCSEVIGALKSRVGVPVFAVEPSRLPVNAEKKPSDNHAWLMIELRPEIDSTRVALSWGSAMSVAGAGQKQGEARLDGPLDIDVCHAELVKAILGKVPF